MGALESQPLEVDEAGRLALAIEAFAIDAPIVKAPVLAETLLAPIARRPLEVVVASSAPVADRAEPGAPAPQAAPAVPPADIPVAQTELQQLVESLASFSSQGGLSAANDMAFDEPLAALGAIQNWRDRRRSDCLHVRQLDL